MLTLCDALRALTSPCLAAGDDADARYCAAGPKRDDPARAKELGLYNGRANGGGAPPPFAPALRRSAKLRVTRRPPGNGRQQQQLEDVLGFELEPSARPDFRACVAAVSPGSEAASVGVRVDALVVALDGKSVRGWSLHQLRSALQRAVMPSPLTRAASSVSRVDMENPTAARDQVVIEFAQHVEGNGAEATSGNSNGMDRNPYALTHFPSPQGEQLPGVRQFFEDSEHETVVPAASEDEGEHASLPLHRRERSRSFKHFWMSDRSSKACYECEQLFTFFRRRHHCRSCGQIFCANCCARLPQSFGGSKVDDSISRLRKQLVCHTCHRQLREGLQMELTGATFETEGVAKSSDSSTSQTLLLMPQHITEALERSMSDTSQWKHLDKGELFDRDEISDDTRSSEQPDKIRATAALFTMFPKVQIKASVQHLAHQPHLHELGKDSKQREKVIETRPRASSETVVILGREDTRKEDLVRSFNKLKRSNSSTYIGNPSIHRWSEAEFKRLVAQSHAEARIAGTFPSSKGPTSSRPKALSGNFDTTHFGTSVSVDPFGSTGGNGSSAVLRQSGGVERARNSTVASYAESDRVAIKESKILSVIGLSDDACDGTKDPEWRCRKQDVLQEMAQHAQTRLEERIFHMLEHSSEISKLFMLEQHRWMQIINLFTNRAAMTVSCEPDQGDSMDIMEYVRVQCLEGGRVQDSFFIDGVMVHKSLARKGMRSDILKPRILLLATELDYQRKKEAISSLESVAGQEVEYMHIVTEKIMTLRPDIVMFEGHVHRVAEELLFKANVAVVKNVRLIDLQRIARCTGSSILTSYDHVDKMSDKGIIGTCARFYVMVSDQAPKSAKRISYKLSSLSMSHALKAPNGDDSDRASVTSTTSSTFEGRQPRRRRVQRQNIVFEGGLSAKGCTLCLRGGSPEVFSEVTEILASTIRVAYNMRLQRAVLAEYGYVPPPEQTERSVAEEWFAKCSTSLYISLKSNSLSMRAALKETQSMCKWCKAHTRYNNISSLRVLRGAHDRDDASGSVTNGGCVIAGDVAMNECTCGSKLSYALRDRILFSTCWSSLEGKSASKAEMMCIDFYSSNDMSLGQFLEKFCFEGSKTEFKRAFTTSKLSFSHDTGRITFRVKDLSDVKDQNEKQMPAADLLRDINHRAVLRLVQSDKLVLWFRSVAGESNLGGTSPLSVQYSILPRDARNYSFGKFLEDLFYGKAMSIDVNRFPHLAGVTGSRDPSLVRFFSRRGRVVSVQFEPLEPVLHVALQPALWQDHVDHEQQLVAVHELCDLAREVYVVTTSKIAESMADPVAAFHAKHNLKILRNEVQQWYSCFASKLESSPPQDIFAHNAHFKQIYDNGVRWSLRITQAVQATVRPTLKNLSSSPKSALPRAWFDQLPSGTTQDLMNQGPSTSTSTPTSTINFQEPGSLENLASFARSLALARANGGGTPVGFSHVANEVTNTLRLRNAHTASVPELNEAWSMEENFDAYDETSRSFPNGSIGSGSFSANPNVYANAASTIGSISSKQALENFRRIQQAKKGDELGYLKLPKRLLAWHPSLPSGANNKVVLVNATQPTSVVAYSLFSKEYAKCVKDYIRREASSAAAAAAATSTDSVAGSPTDEVTRSMLRILRASARTNVDHSFVDENQFQAATTRFSCKSYYAMQFHALRHLYYGGDRNYVESLCECQQWNAAGGKSGAGFLKTRDERFIAKAIPEIELQMFLSMASEYFGYMAKTFENDLSSMLCKTLGIYKVSIVEGEREQKMCVIVMENLMYGREVNFSFDLKGKMDGRYKTVDPGESRPVLWDRNFVEIAGGIPLPLQESAMSLLLSAIMNDTGFLASVQATDYSMLVGYDVNKQEIVASIIDYIHKYDFMKMMEHAGKRLIQEEGEITVLNPKHYRKRFCRAMTKYFVTIPSRYTKVTIVSSSRSAPSHGLPPIGSGTYSSSLGVAMNASAGSTGTAMNASVDDDRDENGSQYGFGGLNSALSTPHNAADYTRNGRTW